MSEPALTQRNHTQKESITSGQVISLELRRQAKQRDIDERITAWENEQISWQESFLDSAWLSIVCYFLLCGVLIVLAAWIIPQVVGL